MAEAAGGAERLQRMIDAGANPTDVTAWRDQKRQQMVEAGAPPAEVDSYWGVKPPVDSIPMPKVNAYIQAQFDMLDPATRQKVADGPVESFKAGLQMSSSSLPFGLPGTVQNEQGGFVDKVAFAAGQTIGDAPLAAVGGAAGYVNGGWVGAGAVGSALPEAVRQILMDQYDHPGGAATWGDVADRAAKVAWETGKAAIVGAVGGGVTGATGRFVGSKINDAVGIGAGGIAGMLASVGTQAALEMRVPSVEDFGVAAVMLIGGAAGHKTMTISGEKFKMTAAGEYAASKMRGIFRDTGIHPMDLVRMAREDSALRSEILAPENALGERVTPGLDAVKPQAPEPFQQYKPRIAAAQEKLVASDVALDPVLDLVGSLETGHIKSEAARASVMSPAGAVGYYQVMPNTARQYGFDPSRLSDKQYNAQVSRTVLADLSNRFNGDLELMLIGYNAGPGRAQQFLRSGRDYSVLPAETRGYLANAERKGQLDRGIVQKGIEAELRTNGMEWNDAAGLHIAHKTARADISFLDDASFRDVMVTRKTATGEVIPDPDGIATYMQNFGRLANFKFQVGDEPYTVEGAWAKDGPQAIPTGEMQGDTYVSRESVVWMPKADDVLVRRWTGLGNYEILHHEAGHAIDRFMNNGRFTTWLPEGTPLHAELIAASKNFKPKLWEKQPDYNATPTELMADAFAVWLSDPTMRDKMPNFKKAYGDRLKQFEEAAAKALPVRGEDGKWQMPPGPETQAGGGAGGDGKPPIDQGSTAAGGARPRKMPRIEDDTMKLTEEELIAKRMDEIGAPGVRVGVRPEWLKADTWFAKLSATMVEKFQALQSELAPARRLDAKLGHDTRAVTIEDMARMTYASRHFASFMMNEGTIDAISRQRTSDNSWKKAYETVAKNGGTADGFIAYMQYARAIEKAAQGVDTGINLDHANRYLNIEGVRGKYAEAADVLRASKDALVDYFTDSGMLPKDRADAMKALNREHIVMKRIMDPKYDPPAPGREMGVRAAPQRMRGDSDRKFVDPMTAEWDNFHTLTSLADRNRAIVGMVNAIEQWKAKQPKQLGKDDDIFYVEKAGDEILKSGKGELQDEYGNVIPEQAKKAWEPFIALRNAYERRGADEMVFFRDGQPFILKIKDPDIAKLFRVVGREQPSQFFNIATKLAGLERAGISMDPTYFLRSWSTGQISKAIQGEEGVSRIPYQNMLRGIAQTWTKGDVYERWVLNGGVGSALVETDRSYFQHGIDKMFKNTDERHGVWNVFSNPGEALWTGLKFAHRKAQDATIFMDQAARVADFISAERNGQEPFKAAMTSRKSQLDYAEQLGKSQLDAWSRMVPFMKTGWKDMEQMLSRVAHHPVAFATAGTMILTLPTAINYAVNWLADRGKKDDDPTRYHNLPQWQRDMYWVTPEIGGQRFKIPRGIGPATAMFATTTERFLDHWAKEDPKGLSDWAKTVAGQFLPPLMPSLAQPVVDQWKNKTELGQPLISAQQEGASGWMQYNPDTTETSKALSKLLGDPGWGMADASPAVIENYARQWAGSFPLKIAQSVEGWTGMREDGRPSSMADNLLVGWFFVRNPVGGEAVNTYYEKRKEFMEQVKNKSLAIGRMNDAELSEVDFGKAEVNLRKIDEGMTNIRKSLNAIYTDKKMTDAEKRKHIDAAAWMLVGQARLGMEVLRDPYNVKIDLTTPAK